VREAPNCQGNRWNNQILVIECLVSRIKLQIAINIEGEPIGMMFDK
jgi:hypothetical protein